MAQSLDLKDIKKEQRRVAALLGHEVKTEPYNIGDITNRSSGVTFCICSGPNVAKNVCAMHKKKRKPRMEGHHPKHSLSGKRSKSVDSAEMLRLKRENVLLRGQSITPHCRSPTIIKGLPNVKLHGKVKGKDIEEFDYRNLNKDVITNELGGPDSLPGIYHNNYNNGLRGPGVPDNSPRTTARRKKGTKLPKIEGKKRHKAIIQVSVNGHQRQNSYAYSEAYSEDTFDVYTMENEDSEKHNKQRNKLAVDYCQCVKPEPEPASPNSRSSGYQTDSRQNIALQNCLKCGKILKEQTGNHQSATRHGENNLQRYFDPHASTNDEGAMSFSRQNTFDSVSSTSYVRITDEFIDLSDSEQHQMKNGTLTKQKNKEKKTNATKDHHNPEILVECSEDEISNSDYHGDLYDSKKQTPTSESLKLNLDGPQHPNDKAQEEKSFKKKNNFTRASNLEIYDDGHKEAYLKALAMAQVHKLPDEPWMLSSRISRSHEFSYFDPFTYGKHCKTCDQYLVKNKRPKVDEKIQKIKPKRHIFGHLDVDDFYPGGKRNPLEMRRKYGQNAQS